MGNFETDSICEARYLIGIAIISSVWTWTSERTWASSGCYFLSPVMNRRNRSKRDYCSLALRSASYKQDQNLTGLAATEWCNLYFSSSSSMSYSHSDYPMVNVILQASSQRFRNHRSMTYRHDYGEHQSHRNTQRRDAENDRDNESL